MLKSETANVLAKIQVIDNRIVDKTTVDAWFEIIGELEYRDALDAVVVHQRNSTDYITPAHVMSAARAVRKRRYDDTARQAAIEAARKAQTADPSAVRVPLTDAAIQARFPDEYRKGQAEGASTRAYWTALRANGGDTRAADVVRQETYRVVMDGKAKAGPPPTVRVPSPNDHIEPEREPTPPPKPSTPGAGTDLPAPGPAQMAEGTEYVVQCPKCPYSAPVEYDHPDPDSVFDDVAGHVTRHHVGTDWKDITLEMRKAENA